VLGDRKYHVDQSAKALEFQAQALRLLGRSNRLKLLRKQRGESWVSTSLASRPFIKRDIGRATAGIRRTPCGVTAVKFLCRGD